VGVRSLSSAISRLVVIGFGGSSAGVGGGMYPGIPDIKACVFSL
jgi:hypothetical protein